MPAKTITKPRCTVCHHPERHRIELLRIAGTPTDTIVERYPDLGRDAVYRHMQNHVDAETKASLVLDVPMTELVERAVKEGGSLIDHFQVVRLTVMSAMQRASAVGDYSGTAALAKRAVEVNQAIGRLSGELLNSTPIGHFTQNNIVMGSPVMARLEGMLVERLTPFPDALRAVLAGLADLDGTPTPPIIEMPALEASYAA